MTPTAMTMKPAPDTEWPRPPPGWKGPWPPWSPWAAILRQKASLGRDLALVATGIALDPEFAKGVASGSVKPADLGVRIEGMAWNATVDFAQALTSDLDDDWCPTRPKRWPGPTPWPPIGVLDVHVAAAKRDLTLFALAIAATPALRERAAADPAGLDKELDLDLSKDALGKAGRFAQAMG